MLSSLPLLVGLAVSPPPPPVKSQPLQVAAPVSLSADERVLFDEAEQALARFEAMRITIPPGADLNAWAQAFSQGMQAQSQAMADLQSRYARLGTSARPEISIPAQVRAGEVMEKFAAELEQIAVPGMPDPGSQKAVSQALIQGAQGIRQAARQYYLAAIDRAQVAGFQGEWVDFARARVAALDKATPVMPLAPVAPVIHD